MGDDMDASTTMTPALRFSRLLPYIAVLQTDLRQTPKNWVWRTWVLASLVAASLYLTHRFAIYRDAKFVQTVDKVVGNLLHWSALGTVTLVIAFVSGAIAAERGSLADSVLCRGISRYQYFLAKLHARLVSVLGTYLFLAGGILTISAFLFPGLVTFTGCFAALGAIAAILAAVVCCGVAISAMCSSQMLSVSTLWVSLYAIAFALTFLPESYLTPDRLIDVLPKVLRGEFDRDELWRLTSYSLAASGITAFFGMMKFSRADV